MDSHVAAHAVQGDADALAFLRAIAFVLHTWDDLADRDRVITDADVNTAFTLALIDLPRNAFYRAHFDDLNPILFSAITNWRIANALERQAEPAIADLTIAFVIRSTYVDLLTMSAALIGGKEWAVQEGISIRRWAHGEGFIAYMSNLAAEKAARKGYGDVLR